MGAGYRLWLDTLFVNKGAVDKIIVDKVRQEIISIMNGNARTAFNAISWLKALRNNITQEEIDSMRQIFIKEGLYRR